jgi:hypothetical protein
VMWTGLNLRAVTSVCRELLAWNAADPGNPAIWFVGRSRIEPEKNQVVIRCRTALKHVRVGDEILRFDDGTFDVEPRDATH